MTQPAGRPVEQSAQDPAVEIDQLKQALASCRRIGVAMGIVMAVHTVDEEQALRALKTVSQVTNRKMREVAEDVINSRQLPALPPRATGRATAARSARRRATPRAADTRNGIGSPDARPRSS